MESMLSLVKVSSRNVNSGSVQELQALGYSFPALTFPPPSYGDLENKEPNSPSAKRPSAALLRPGRF
jgi:hypothetical protein